MNKKLMLAGLFGVMLIASVLSVSAWAGGYTSFKLVEKNPSDWSVVDGGHEGKLTISQSLGVEWTPVVTPWFTYNVKTYVINNAMSFSSSNLESNTDYTLIYYGDATHNDEWNYATCIANGVSSSIGKLNVKGIYVTPYSYGDILKDDFQQKFWLVESSDVDCDNGEMTAWNPTNYLFETKTV